MVNSEEFIAQYSSENTKRTYRTILNRYLTLFYPGIELNDASVKYLNSGRDYRADMIHLRDSIAKMAPKTRLSTMTVCFRWLEENEIDFPRSFKRNLIGKEAEAISEEHLPTPAEIGRVMEYLPLIGRAITIVLASSGMRPSEPLKVRLSDLELDRDPPRINLRSSITKTKKRRIVFISSEAKAIVEEWLRFREQHMAVTAKRVRKTVQDDRLFPLIVESYERLWLRALKNAKLARKDTQTGRYTFHPHNLRKFFKTYSSFQNPEIGECLMGHLSGVRAIYGRYQDAEAKLEEAYREVMPRLSIFQHSKMVSELKEQVKQQSNDIDSLVRATTLKNAKLEVELQDTKDRMDGLEVLVKTLVPPAMEKVMEDLPKAITQFLEDGEKRKAGENKA